jgi:DNA-binding NarL/FixJ family response regulator
MRSARAVTKAPIVVVSGSPKFRRGCIELGAAGFLDKNNATTADIEAAIAKAVGDATAEKDPT